MTARHREFFIGGCLGHGGRRSKSDTGPFPKVEASGPAPGRPVIVSTAIPLGDRTFYKKVVWDDQRGTRHSSWIKLNFVPFYTLHDVTWKDGC